MRRQMEQRNLDRRALKALDAEARQTAAAIIELEARKAAIGRYDDVRATQEANLDAERRSASATAREFAAAAAKTTEPVAPSFDRDAAEAAWTTAVDFQARAPRLVRLLAQTLGDNGPPTHGADDAGGGSGWASL
jgi:hypothetical protein